MATKIRNTDTGELVEIALIHGPSGPDFLCDVMGGAGCTLSDEDGIDFALDAEEVAWWTRWAEREQRINDTIEERGLENIIPCFYDGAPDWESAQDEYEKFLGL